MLDEQEKRLLSRFIEEYLQDKKRNRRRKLIFRWLMVGIVVVALGATLKESEITNFNVEHTALIKLDGPILADFPASADNINQVLREAYENDLSKAIILEINTPGGSPVQAGRIYGEIKRLKEEYPDKLLYAVISDVCASGGMYVAAAADKIYSDQASIVGSIGVIMQSFGLEKAIEKIGVERRVMTAGKHKALLDPFLPQNPEINDHMQVLLDQIHQQFIQRVEQGRGNKLASDTDLFSGLIWTGEQAKILGLVDAFGDAFYVAKEVVKQENLLEYKTKGNFFDAIIERSITALIRSWLSMTASPWSIY